MEHGMKEAFKLIRGRGFIEASKQPRTTTRQRRSMQRVDREIPL